MRETKETKNGGITLISLVITIIVLLILAAISIATLTGSNGLLTRATQAKVANRAGTVEEKVKIRQTEWNSSEILGEDVQSQATEKENELINELLKDGDITEGEIDRNAKTITIGKKVINYDLNTKLTNIFVALYSDGTLAFNNKDEFTPEEGVAVEKEYGNIKGEEFSRSSYKPTPWANDEITKITILSKIVPTSTASWFEGIRGGLNVENISNLDTSEVTDMSYMFMYSYDSEGILDIRGLDTSKVKNMKGMFAGGGMYAPGLCKKILGLEDLDTSNVENMSFMFAYNSKLEELNLTNFDTSKVEDMSYMFAQRSGDLEDYSIKVKTLDLRNFNTSNVTNMSNMFSGCENLEDLYINFDTSKVENMEYMFYSNTKLKSLDCSQWNVNRVTKHGYFNYSAPGVIAPTWKN